MRNYLAVLFRVIRRERLYAAINIAGLSLGVACCVLLGSFLWSELTYDRHFDNHAHIFRVVNEFIAGGSQDGFATTSRALGPMLASDYPAIKALVRFQSNGGGNGSTGGLAVHHGDDTYYWQNSYFADDNVFQVFSHKIIYGDPQTALKDAASVAVSERFARKYFGNANPIGETIKTDSGTASRITLVFADLPPNTHLKYDLLFSGNSPYLRESDDPTARRLSLWSPSVYTYLVLAPDFDPGAWPRISEEFFKRYMAVTAKTINGSWHSWLQPLTSIHLHSDIGYDRPTGNSIYLYGCAAVALFILVVACINYVNLATARATRRAHSVGIRKILGASRLSLGMQFLGEAVLFSLAAEVLGLAIAEIALRLTGINALMGQQVSLDVTHHPAMSAAAIGLGVLVGLLTGIYPAFYLSSWAPLSALANKNSASQGNLRLREALVLVQFTVSVAVITCTMLMAAQLRYIGAKSLGFKKENQLVVTLRGVSTIERINTIRTELARNSGVLGESEAEVIVGQPPALLLISMENNAHAMTPFATYNMPIGADFVRVAGLTVVQGRDFSSRLLTDIGANFLVNEAAVRKMGWTEPLGKRVQLGNVSGRVVGVVQDFNFKSLHTLVEPLVMYPLVDDFASVPEVLRAYQQRLLIVNISGRDVDKTLRYVEGVMAKVDPKHPFEYQFLDEALDNLYQSEHRLTKLLGIFASICILIACLGVFALAAFTTEQRNREIGIRKVLGATTWQIISLLSRRILVLVLTASALAAFMSYFAMDEWLTGFAYRTSINPVLFVVAGAAAAVLAFVTVALQSFRVASADPVVALRDA
jgi:putative ABC transport system permease protein